MNKGLRLYLSESMGIAPGHIELLEVDGSGVLVQFCKHVRGHLTIDHDDDEYCYFNTKYGLREVYDTFKADDFNDAFNKMIKLNNKLDKAV